MAAVIAAAHRFGGDEEHEENNHLEAFEFGEGEKVTVGQVAAHVHELGVNINILNERLVLESHLTTMLMKLPCFLLAMLTFVMAILALVPSAAVAEVHTHIRNHYQVYKANLDEVKSYEDIYAFITTFEHANEELQATGPLYWCEGRYFEYVFEDRPTRYCPSPRLNSLGFHGETPTTWAQWYNSGGSNRRRRGVYGADTENGGDSSDDHHRRLQEQRARAATRLGMKRRLADSHDTTDDNHTDESGHGACVDDDEELQREEGDPTLTCENFRDHVCDIDLGILLCPVTCGYCPSFVYEKAAKFDQPLVTMLPVMVFQTRFQTGECTGFAKTYEEQTYNTDLFNLPALDGERHGRVLTCIDRTKHYEGDYAFHVECPENISLCYEGDDGHLYLKDSKIHTYHGEPVYAKFLAEPEKFIGAMEAIGWLDKQTETVTLSTLVYTEGQEIFTSVSVVFTMDEAGNVEGELEVISMHDLINANKTMFLVCLSITSFLSFVGMCLTAWNLLRNDQCKWGLEMYELLSRTMLAAYSLVLLFQWLQQVPMAEEFDLLLHTVLDFHGHGSEAWEELIQDYFDVKGHIYEETTWLYRHRIAIFAVCYAQFLQLIFYFAAHPRLALLTSTIGYGADTMVHFAGLFISIFLFLAFMGHWMLGGDLEPLRDFYHTLTYMVNMFYGDELLPEGTDKLPVAMQVMAWIFGITFLLVVFFSLVNFFLAIVVDAFMTSKEKVDAQCTEKSFFVDALDVPFTVFQYMRHRWPKKRKVVALFRQEDDGDGITYETGVLGALHHQAVANKEAEAQAHGSARKVQHARCPAGQCLLWKNPGHEDALILPLFTATKFLEEHFQSQEKLLSFLAYYYKKVPEILVHIDEDVNKEAILYEKKHRASMASLASGVTTGGSLKTGVGESAAGSSPPGGSPKGYVSRKSLDSAATQENSNSRQRMSALSLRENTATLDAPASSGLVSLSDFNSVEGKASWQAMLHSSVTNPSSASDRKAAKVIDWDEQVFKLAERLVGETRHRAVCAQVTSGTI
mmetsp:Transcript_23437/g.54597  ORF Transcript_23437/g.54597 Transcript_23437/m.54597 type:complete len:1028 (-) Transcript_23437:67-3150(-)